MCSGFSQRQENITPNTSRLPLATLGITPSPLSLGTMSLGFDLSFSQLLIPPTLQLEGCQGLQAVGIPALKSGSQGKCPRWLGDSDLLPT